MSACFFVSDISPRLALVTDAQAFVMIKPSNGSRHDPTGNPRTAAMRDASPRQAGLDAECLEFRPLQVGVVGAIALHPCWASPGVTHLAADRWDGFQQGQQLRDVMSIGPSQEGGQRDAAAIGQNLVFAARPASTWSARWSCASNTACKRCQTAAPCQAANRRQQVIPEPQPISWGRSSQAIPGLSTNTLRVSVKAWRSPSGLPPEISMEPYCCRWQE